MSGRREDFLAFLNIESGLPWLPDPAAREVIPLTVYGFTVCHFGREDAVGRCVVDAESGTVIVRAVIVFPRLQGTL